MAFGVIKSSGRTEEFSPEKLINSLVRSGAQPEVAREIAAKVQLEMKPSLHTKAIFRMAKRFLREYNHASGMRYSLKTALSCLGPSGYPFERYFARVLREYGYATEVGRIIDGYCVRHEVDILASKGNEQFVIECKYHANGGLATDVKVALYVHSRFNDIKKAFETSGRGAPTVRGWLATNTRCTIDAVRYAECSGLKITSWKYPDSESLEKLIEGRRLYPVTILPGARKNILEQLFRKEIILAQEVADMDETEFTRKSGLDADTAALLAKQAKALCPCS